MDESDYKFSAAEIVEITGGRLLQGSFSSTFKEISTDSRTIGSGELFLALKGEHFDGHRFVSQAFEKGAHGAIVRGDFPIDQRRDDKRTIIAVEDPLRSLGDLARSWRIKHRVKIVGVTGSNGKTTTKEMIGSILGTLFNTLKTEGNFNNLVGLPLTLLRLRERDDVAVLEMGTNTRFEIKRLAEISEPDIAVITNVGETHLEGLRSVEEVAEEKGDLFRALRGDGVAVINEDDPRIRRAAGKCKCKKIHFGMTRAADLMARDVSISDAGTVKFRLSNRGGDVDVDLPVYGGFNVYNALAAAGVARALGVGLDVIKTGLEEFEHLPGRMEVIESDGYIIVNDTYNSNPNSAEEALRTLVGFEGEGRTIAVLGDMLELGTFTRPAHIRIGGLVSGLGVDYLFTLGENAADFALGASQTGMNEEKIYMETDHQTVVSKLRGIIRKGDRILIKGSRAMRMERIVEEL